MANETRSYRFPHEARLRATADFDRVFAARNRAGDSLVNVYAIANQLLVTRLGIAVSTKYGNAVKRNRMKRRIREAFRLIRHELPTGLDLVVMPRPGQSPKSAEIEVSLRKLLPMLMHRIHPV